MFFKNIIKKAKETIDSALDSTEEVDNHFFAKVIEEIEKGFKDKGLEGKAIAMTGGDKKKADSQYMQMRAEALQEEFIEDQEEVIREKESAKLSLEAEEKRIKEEKQKAFANDKVSRIINQLVSGKSTKYFLNLYKNELEDEGYNQTSFFSTGDLEKDGAVYWYMVSSKDKTLTIIDAYGKSVITYNLEDKIL